MARTPHPRSRTDFGWDVRLVTIPHTGTFTTQSLLDGLGVSYTQAHVKRSSDEHWRDYPRRRGWVLCTLRDPVMVAISSMNRGQRFDLGTWETVAAWWGEPNVHFLRIDVVEANQQRELDRLAAFLDVPTARGDWTPRNTSPDALDLKPGYARGTPHADVSAVEASLARMPSVVRLFAEHGYALPWMG